MYICLVLYLCLLYVYSQTINRTLLKRCDQNSTPMCGPCDGIGGMIWGDGIDQIDFTSCTIISYPNNTQNISKPLFPKQFTNHIDGILIEPFREQDPHLYLQDNTTFYYDAINSRIRFNNIVMPEKDSNINIEHSENWHLNFTFFTYHNATTNNIVDDVCICPQLEVGILEYDAFADAQYLGRVLLGIEYLEEQVVVDHFVKLPHHIFIDISTGLPIRAWQPFNGLQVYSQWNFSDPDDSVWKLPKACQIAIEEFGNCSKTSYNGYDYDMMRARNKYPGRDYLGSDGNDMVNKLNKHLLSINDLKTKDCKVFDINELNEIGLILWNNIDDDFKFNEIYKEMGDTRRLRYDNMEHMKDIWNNEILMINNDTSLLDEWRNNKCREMVMIYVHHLSEDNKRNVHNNMEFVLPLLPKENEKDDDEIKRIPKKLDSLAREIHGFDVNANNLTACYECHVKPPWISN